MALRLERKKEITILFQTISNHNLKRLWPVTNQLFTLVLRFFMDLVAVTPTFRHVPGPVLEAILLMYCVCVLCVYASRVCLLLASSFMQRQIAS